MAAVYHDCDYPTILRNKNFDNFKRRCKSMGGEGRGGGGVCLVHVPLVLF